MEMDYMAIREEMDNEHKAWMDMCKEIQQVFNISSEEFNMLKYLHLVVLIERWAYYDRIRRAAIVEQVGKDKHPFGLFWKGDD
jgi:hypothetical protein